jgi:hypothetical protein
VCDTGLVRGRESRLGRRIATFLLEGDDDDGRCCCCC